MEQRLAINVTVSDEEYEFVRLQAYLSRSSMSAYVRQLITSDRKKKKEPKAMASPPMPHAA
jgi:hypothetical protein